jgi:hypothetical protein
MSFVKDKFYYKKEEEPQRPTSAEILKGRLLKDRERTKELEQVKNPVNKSGTHNKNKNRKGVKKSETDR